ncbi:MAG: ribosomal protein large subunit ribosomal protein [Candidatus Parcubacteria bacterium]|jgi:large subunit ribosomal protein L17
MKHHKKQRKFGRESNQRIALMRSLARNLIRDEAITTTEAKAKELRPYVEELVTKARVASVATRRLITARLGGDDDLAKKLIEDIAPQYATRPGGYTRITKLPLRQNDAAKMAHIEFVK